MTIFDQHRRYVFLDRCKMIFPEAKDCSEVKWTYKRLIEKTRLIVRSFAFPQNVILVELPRWGKYHVRARQSKWANRNRITGIWLN